MDFVIPFSQPKVKNTGCTVAVFGRKCTHKEVGIIQKFIV